MSRTISALIVSAAVAAVPVVSSAAPLFEDNFNTDTSANWSVYSGPGSNAATFGVDYFAKYGIPASPNGGGTTTGLVLEANRTGLASGVTGISVSPIGGNFTGDYIVKYDAWLNFNGNVTTGGTGSTQLTNVGIGTAGAGAQYQGSLDSLMFGATGDGQSAQDYRVYGPGNAGVQYAADSGVFAAGTATTSRNNTDPYYAGKFGGVSAPASVLAKNPAATGTTSPGALGFDWHEVQVTKVGNTVNWKIDGFDIATVDISSLSLAGTNIFLGQSDTFNTAQPDGEAGNLVFGLIDNLQLTVVPEPASLSLVGLGALAALRRRRA